MEFYNEPNLNISQSIYEQFLKVLEKNISDNEFQKAFEKTQKIDEKYYSESITIEELKNIISEYKEKEIINVSDIKKVQINLSGNPEFVFRLGIESLRNNARMIINIDDFCLAQDTILVEVLNMSAKEIKLSNILKLQNLLKDDEIFEISEKVDMTICFGNSNDYHRLNKKYKISNLKFDPYCVFELYTDSYDLEEVKRGVYEYAMRNQFCIEIYDMDLEIDDIIEDINKNGAGFCSILLSKDKEKIKRFKENIKSKYVFVNENPFSKIKFEFDLSKI